MNLRLRRPERDDLDAAVEWMADPAFQDFLYGGNENVPVRGLPVLLALLGGAVTMHINPAGHLLVDTVESGPIGIVAISDVAWRNRTGMIEVYLSPANRSELTVAETYAAAITYVFDELNLHRAGLRIDARDKVAKSIVETLGAVLEVTLRGHILADTTPVDVYEFGMLRPEYETRKTAVGNAHGA